MAQTPAATQGGDQAHEIDWLAAENSAEFKELIAKKRRFVIPATIFFFVWYFGFIVLASVSPETMGESIYQGFNLGYLFALTQFVMVWVLGAMYLRRADRDFDPLAARAAEQAIKRGGGSTPPSGAGREEVAR